MVTVRMCTDPGTIPNMARNEFSTSYTMYIVCLLLLLWLQSGHARIREPSPTRLVTSSPPVTRAGRGSPTGVALDTRC